VDIAQWGIQTRLWRNSSVEVMQCKKSSKGRCILS
jgi:hypothetical protein